MATRPGPWAWSAEVVEGGLDRAVERGVGIDHLAEPPHRNPGVHGHGEPAEVAPTRIPLSASSTSLMKPSLPALWIQPRVELGTWVLPTRTVMPRCVAWASVRPTAPISGSVKVTLGTA